MFPGISLILQVTMISLGLIMIVRDPFNMDLHSFNPKHDFFDNVIIRSIHIYTASKVKHHLNIFLEKTVKLSKHNFFLVTFLKRDKVVTIYSKFRFDYH